MSRIKLLRVIPDLQMGGVQRMLLRTLEKIVPMGVDAEVCCIRAERGQLEDHLDALGIPVHHIPFHSRLDPFGLWRLRKLIVEGGFQIVHGHMYVANIAINLAMIRQPGVAIVNGYHSQRPFLSSNQARMIRWTRDIPAAWIAVSNSVKAPLLDLGVPDSRIHVIYNGIAVHGKPKPLPQRANGDPLELVWAGRFVPQKRHIFMLGVVEACKTRGIPVNLTLVGDGPALYKSIKHVASNNLAGVVRFMGVQDNVWPFLANAELFVSTSNREGFPNALIEACAAGRGFLASDIPPHSELCGSSGAGLLFGENVDDWVNAIEGLVADRTRVARMGAAAAGLSQVYTVDVTATKTMELYRKLMGQDSDGSSIQNVVPEAASVEKSTLPPR